MAEGLLTRLAPDEGGLLGQRALYRDTAALRRSGEDRPLLRADLYPGENDYFRRNPHVAGMATEDGRVILNPYSSLSDDEQGAVYLNEASRLLMRESSPPSFNITPEQRERFATINNGQPYGSEQDIRETIAARILSGDPSAGAATPEQFAYARGLGHRMSAAPGGQNSSDDYTYQHEGQQPAQAGLLDQVEVNGGLLAQPEVYLLGQRALARDTAAMRRPGLGIVPNAIEYARENPIEAGATLVSMSGVEPLATAADAGLAVNDVARALRDGRWWDAGIAGATGAASVALPFVPYAALGIKRSTDLPDLRSMPVDEAVEVAAKEPHLIPSNSEAEGKYVGGPRVVKSKRGLNKIRNEFDAYVAADPRGGDWYDRYRAGVDSVTGGDPRDNLWMANMEGQWSAGVSPSSELAFALKENNAALAGMPVKAARPAQHEAFMAAVEANDPSLMQLGDKTGEYARRINPNVNATPTATGVNDFRHVRNLQYTDASGNPQRDALTAAQHRFVDYETALAVKRANETRLDGRDNWTGEQLQAAPWVRQKAFAILRDRPAILQRRLDSGLSEADAYAAAYEDAFQEATKTIADNFPKHTAFATYEAQPGAATGHLPQSVTASDAERIAYASDPRSTWATAPGGRDAIYSGMRLGDTGVSMRVLPTQPMTGVYQSPGGLLETNPGEVARPLIGFDSGKVKAIPPADRALLEAGESLRAYVDAQDAAAAHKVWDDGQAGLSNSLFLPMDGPVPTEGLLAVRDAAAAQGLGDVVDTGSGLTVTSFYPDPPARSSKEMTEVVSSIEDALPDRPIEARRVKVDGIYQDYVDQWRAGEGSGAATEKLLKDINKTPEIRAALDNNPYLAENALSRLSRDEEWAKKWGSTRADIQTARRIIGDGPGWVGRLESAVKKGALPAILLGAVLSQVRFSEREPQS